MADNDGSPQIKLAYSALRRHIEWYGKAAEREKRAFIRGTRVVRILGFLAAAVVVASALRIDELVIQILSLPGWDATRLSRLGQFAAAVGILLSFLAYWNGRSLRERGRLRGWVRYSITLKKLKDLNSDLDGLALTVIPGALVLPQDTIAALNAIVEKARVLTDLEIEHWASDATADLTAFVESGRDAGKLAGHFRTSK